MSVFLLWMLGTAAGRIITVDDDGPADFDNIQAAIDDSNDGDTIELQPGTYTGDDNRDIDFFGKAITVRSIDPNDPNVVAATIIDCNGTTTEPHRGFYFHRAETSISVLNGFAITNGYAKYGGGIYCSNGSEPTIINCTFSRNSAEYDGGGLYNWNSSPELTNCTFSNNSAHWYGGGIYDVEYSNPMLTKCSFRGNSANRGGGGIANRVNSSPVVTYCTFSVNSAGGEGGGGMHNRWDSNPVLTRCMFTNNSAGIGGGMMNLDNSSPILRNCTFSRNLAGNGGGMANDKASCPVLANCTFSENLANAWGGGICNDESSPTLANCTFIKNSANSGGGMGNWYSNSPVLTQCAFSENSASFAGGGLFDRHSNSKLAHCTFSKNSAAGNGGGIANEYFGNPTIINCIFSENLANSGGAIYSDGSSPTMVNCTMAGNNASNGNALACDSWQVEPRPSNVQITNCILWNGGGEIWNNDSSTIIITYSDVQSGWLGESNIDADPCFVDANNGDYHLLPDSPCINAGDPDYVAEPNETDLDGKPRVIGGRIDMGAYEYPNTAPVACIVGGDRIVEAEGTFGARVTLDGSGSSDADSAPGTNDDIAHFDWYKVDACNPNFEDFLASGEIIDCNLPLGEHIIVLEVIDRAGAFDTNEVTIIVQDTTPPEFTLSVTPDTLWPANHKMVLITPSWTASDICDASPEVSLVSITMNEGNDTKGDGHTTLNIQIGDDGSIYLRAERSGSGSGRIYTITYQAVDDSGNVTVARATVMVPHDQR